MQCLFIFYHQKNCDHHFLFLQGSRPVSSSCPENNISIPGNNGHNNTGKQDHDNRSLMIMKSSNSRQDRCVLGEARQDSDPLFSMLMTLQVFSLGLLKFLLNILMWSIDQAFISLPWDVDCWWWFLWSRWQSWTSSLWNVVSGLLTAYSICLIAGSR